MVRQIRGAADSTWRPSHVICYVKSAWWSSFDAGTAKVPRGLSLTCSPPNSCITTIHLHLHHYHITTIIITMTRQLLTRKDTPFGGNRALYQRSSHRYLYGLGPPSRLKKNYNRLPCLNPLNYYDQLSR